MIVTGFNGNTDDEYFYDYLLLIQLLSANFFKIKTSIKILLNKENKKLYEKLINQFNIKLNIEIIEHNFLSSSYNTRYEIIKYFINEKEFLYIDIDAIFLKNIDNFLKEKLFKSKVFYTEKIPDYIKKIEKQYYTIPDYNIFAQWFFIKNKNTPPITIDYIKTINLNTNGMKSLDLNFSKIINNIEYNDQYFGAYYPKHKLNQKQYLFHYDGLIDSGFFNKLKLFNYKLYKYIILFLNRIPNYEGIKNDPKYFDRFQ